MKVSQEQKAQNRSRILTEAGRLFREKGFDAVSVAEVMQAAGLTHGGFYGHFRSKDDLVAQTIAHAVGSQSTADDLSSWVDTYLSTPHRDHPDLGCPMAALAGFMRQQAPRHEPQWRRFSLHRSPLSPISCPAPIVPGAGGRRSAVGPRWSARSSSPDPSMTRRCPTNSCLRPGRGSTKKGLPARQPDAEKPSGMIILDSEDGLDGSAWTQRHALSGNSSPVRAEGKCSHLAGALLP